MRPKPSDPAMPSQAVRFCVLALLIASGLAAGCVGPGSVQRQVERTAKDWCLVVRASQVIPVYPLTEDVVPGDVFLVDVPREEQARVYAAKGFLPLDHHLVRIRPDSYDEFYLKDHGLGLRLPLKYSSAHT